MRPRPKFFTGLKPKKTMQDDQQTEVQTEEVRLDLDTPTEELEAVVEPEVVVEPTTEEVIHEVSEPETAEKKTDDAPVVNEDRSAYNCQPCKGEGMTFTELFPEGKICPECRGTGKIT